MRSLIFSCASFLIAAAAWCDTVVSPERFDETDATSFLQAAIDSGAEKVLIPNPGKPWNVRPLKLRSNLELILESGAVIQAKKGAFLGLEDSVFLAADCQNLVIRGGKGSTIRMFREDYVKAPYQAGEWRMGISLSGCRNVFIENLTIENTGGDGIYIGTGKAPYSENIIIRNVRCLNNHRQGISVISVKGLLIEDSLLANTTGTNPQAGIDFEPNHWYNVIQDVTLRRVTASGNAGPGIVAYLTPLNSDSAPFSITLEQCSAVNNIVGGFIFAFPPESKHGDSHITLRDCSASGNHFEQLRIDDKPVQGSLVKIIGGTFTQMKSEFERYPVVLSASRNYKGDVGNVIFDRVNVKGSYPLVFKPQNRSASMKKISGSVLSDSGTVDMAAYVPPNIAGGDTIPHLNFSGTDYLPLKTGSVPELPDFPERDGWYCRGYADYALYAKAGEKVELEIDYQQVGDYPGVDFVGKIHTPSGAVIDIPAPTFQARTPYSFTAPETGVYRAKFTLWNNKMRLLRANGNIALLQDESSIPLFAPYGRMYFYVPENIEQFSIHLIPDDNENAAAVLYDSKGKVIEKLDFLKKRTILTVTRSTSDGEIWALDLKPPAEGRFEDFSVEINGTIPAFSPTPNSLFQYKK